MFETDLSKIDGDQQEMANRQTLLCWRVIRLLTMGISDSNLQKRCCI